MAKKSKLPKYRTESAASQPVIKTADLPKTIGEPRVGSTVSPDRQTVATHLNPAYMGSLLLRADNGDSQAYFTLGSEILERDAAIRSVVTTRALAVAGRKVKVEAASESDHDKAIATSVYDMLRRPETEALISEMMSGVYFGLSIHEIIWDKQPSHWMPMSFAYRELRHFQWDKDTLSQPRLRSDENNEGTELQPGKWIVHRPTLIAGIPLQTGLLRPLALLYSLKRFTVQQMTILLETMGVPMRVGKYPATAEDQKEKLLDACRRIGTDACAVIPAEMSIEFLDTRGAGTSSDLFLANLDYLDRTVSKVVLGASLAVDQGTKGNGSRAAAQVHDDVRSDLRNADARAIAATLNAQLVQVYVDVNYGPQESYPQVEIDCTDPEDSVALMEAVTSFVNLGGRVEEASLRDRLGLPEPAEGAELLRPIGAQNQSNNPQPENAPQRTRVMTARVESTATQPDTRDVIDELVGDALSDWRDLADPVIGEAMRRVQAAESYEDAQRILAELEGDQGELLDVSKLVASLAKYTFMSRGLGDVSDTPNV